jgi:hypothetical protein
MPIVSRYFGVTKRTKVALDANAGAPPVTADREDLRSAGVRDAWQRGQRGRDLLQCLVASRRLHFVRQHDVQHADVPGVDPRVDGVQLRHAAHEQPRTGGHYDRERDLGHHERSLEAAATAGNSTRARAPDDMAQVPAPHGGARRDGHHGRGEHRGNHRRGENAPAQGRRLAPCAERESGDKPTERQHREQRPDDPGAHPQQGGLGHELLRQPDAIRA